jgi:hypothetical protein
MLVQKVQSAVIFLVGVQIGSSTRSFNSVREAKVGRDRRSVLIVRIVRTRTIEVLSEIANGITKEEVIRYR